MSTWHRIRVHREVRNHSLTCEFDDKTQKKNIPQTFGVFETELLEVEILLNPHVVLIVAEKESKKVLKGFLKKVNFFLV